MLQYKYIYIWYDVWSILCIIRLLSSRSLKLAFPICQQYLEYDWKLNLGYLMILDKIIQNISFTVWYSPYSRQCIGNSVKSQWSNSRQYAKIWLLPRPRTCPYRSFASSTRMLTVRCLSTDGIAYRCVSASGFWLKCRDPVTAWNFGDMRLSTWKSSGPEHSKEWSNGRKNYCKWTAWRKVWLHVDWTRRTFWKLQTRQFQCAERVGIGSGHCTWSFQCNQCNQHNLSFQHQMWFPTARQFLF